MTPTEAQPPVKDSAKDPAGNAVNTAGTDSQIIPRVIEQEMKEAYVNYAMSVIVGRALPDVRDGLKPVHRRIMYAMYELGMFHNKPFKKCARIVGEVLGKFHPHGDTAVYDALVRMAQDFSLRYPLIKGQGNFGCFTGDTKVKLTDGRSLSFKELVKEQKKMKKNYTYTLNANGLIEIAEIKSPRLTKKNEPIMKVILDNGEEIKCTLDHRFMLRNGKYQEAQKLKPGDYLMSLKYFDNFTEIVEQAKTYNHQITKIEFLSKREDVYDLTIDKTHNFALATGVFVHNSIDGDSAAQMRYTEAKMQRIAEEMLKDIEKKTVSFKDNFDGSLQEPEVLPTVLPNLLINGSSGIAVGMATNIPPHNVTEVCEGIIATIDNPEISTEELMEIIPAPDFPTGGEVVCGNALHYAYAKGKGKVTIKAITEIEEDKNKIIVKEIPYQVNKEELIKHIANLVREKRVAGIRNINDESDREGIRIVIDLKKDTDPTVVLNQLYKHSRLKVSFGINLLVLVDNQPIVLGLKNIVVHHINHRKDVITRRTKYDLEEAQKRVHLLEGLLVALENIDAVIPGIKRSRTVEDAKQFLINTYSLSELQAKAILEMRLQKLASLEQEKIKNEHQDLLERIKEYQEILGSEAKVLDLIKTELEHIKTAYGDTRRSVIVAGEDEDFDIEELIEEETVVVTMTNSGYVKRLPLDTYKTQKRGGKGIRAAGMKEEDFVERVYITSTHDYLLYFTDKGQVYWLKVFHIPEASRHAKGKHISNLIEHRQDEKITAVIPVRDFKEGYLFMATKKGVVKKVELMDFSRPRRGGIRAITLDEKDTLVGVRYTSGDKEIILATRKGQANRFREKDVRAMGRTARGVRGIRLGSDDAVIGMLAAEEGRNILTLTEKGYGKRTPVSEYRLCNRGGKGVTNMKITGKNGSVKAVMLVDGKEELMLISRQGIGIRVECSDISIIGRATQGVRVMRLNEGDTLAAAAKIVVEEEQSLTTKDQI